MDDSDDDMSAENSPVDDAVLEQAAAALFQRYPVPKPKLPPSSVAAIAKTVGIDLQDQLAEYLGDKVMKELRYVIMLATQFSRHERALGLRSSDFSKALRQVNSFDPLGADTTQLPEPNADSEPTTTPQILLTRFIPEDLELDETDGKDLTNNSNIPGKSAKHSQETGDNEDEGWQDYISNSNTTSSGDKESPAESEGSGNSAAGSGTQEQYEDPYSEEREYNSDDNDMEFDSKMLPDSCDNIENEIGDEFLDEIGNAEDDDELGFSNHQVPIS